MATQCKKWSAHHRLSRKLGTWTQRFWTVSWKKALPKRTNMDTNMDPALKTSFPSPVAKYRCSAVGPFLSVRCLPSPPVPFSDTAPRCLVRRATATHQGSLVTGGPRGARRRLGRSSGRRPVGDRTNDRPFGRVSASPPAGSSRLSANLLMPWAPDPKHRAKV